MADHSITNNPDFSWFGIKLTFAIAGFWGGVLSLSFIKDLTYRAGVLAVLTGVGSACYLTPIVLRYLFSGATEFESNGVAFVIGLTAMNLIPGFIKLSELWKSDPLSMIRGKRDGSTDE